jgi:predicted nucleic acid-binding protein
LTQSAGVAYLDASALVKLVLEESETPALTAFLERRPLRVSSVVAEVEVHRAARRVDPASTPQAANVLELVNLLDLDRAILDLARTIDPPPLRTLDAIHVASALSLGTDFGEFVTYDERQGEAVEAAGLSLAAPGAARGFPR